MKKSILLFITMLLLTLTSGVQAQTLKEVLDKHFKAIGQDKLSAMKTCFAKRTVSMRGNEFPMELKMKRPNKFRMEIDMQNQKMIQAYDGKEGWFITTRISQQPMELSGDRLKEALSQTDIDGELYQYAQKGFKAELIGIEQLHEQDVYNIKLTSKSGDVKNYYIDANKYLIVMVKAKVGRMGQEAEVVKRMSNYKNFDGVLVATKIESESPMGTGSVTINEIKFNQDIDDSVFKKPSN